MEQYLQEYQQYLHQLSTCRPLWKNEETWLDNYKTQVTCVLCHNTFASEDQLREHSYYSLKCQQQWIRKKKEFLDEIRFFRLLKAEEHEWLNIHYPHKCNVCHEKFDTNLHLRIHKKKIL